MENRKIPALAGTKSGLFGFPGHLPKEGFVRGVYFGRGAGDKKPLKPGVKRIFTYRTPLTVRILRLSAGDSDDLWIKSVRVGALECVLQGCPQSFLEEIFPWGELALSTGQTISITVKNRSKKPQAFDGRMMVQENQ